MLHVILHEVRLDLRIVKVSVTVCVTECDCVSSYLSGQLFSHKLCFINVKKIKVLGNWVCQSLSTVVPDKRLSYFWHAFFDIFVHFIRLPTL